MLKDSVDINFKQWPINYWDRYVQQHLQNHLQNCSHIPAVDENFEVTYSAEDFCLFIDSSRASLKGVLFYIMVLNLQHYLFDTRPHECNLYECEVSSTCYYMYKKYY